MITSSCASQAVDPGNQSSTKSPQYFPQVLSFSICQGTIISTANYSIPIFILGKVLQVKWFWLVEPVLACSASWFTVDVESPTSKAHAKMRWQTVRQFLWGEIPSSKLERRLLLKLDWFILSYCCLMVGCIDWTSKYWLQTRHCGGSISRTVSFTLLNFETGHFACTIVSNAGITNSLALRRFKFSPIITW